MVRSRGMRSGAAAEDPFAKFLTQLQHTSTPDNVTNTRSPDEEEDDDTLAGLPSITDSSPLQSHGKKSTQPARPRHYSLPVTQQLSPGEIRRQRDPHTEHALPFLADHMQTSNASVSMPLSEGEVPHVLRYGRTRGAQVASQVGLNSKQHPMDFHGVAKSYERPDEPSAVPPMANLENDLQPNEPSTVQPIANLEICQLKDKMCLRGEIELKI